MNHSPKQTTAMSLIEIIVAIAILAILVGVAVPPYSAYVNRSHVSTAMGTLEALEIEAKALYEENSSLTSINYGGINIPADTITALENPPVVNVFYIPPGGETYVDNKSFLFCVYVDKLNFSGYVAPTPGNAGTYSRICKLVTAGDKIYTNRCGALDGGTDDIPVKYLPVGCDCANVSTGSC